MYHFLQEIDENISADKNNVKSFEEIEEIALTGEAEAQYHMGLLFDSGIGEIARNPKEAEKWYKLAAEQDHANACYYLARMYELPSSGILNNRAEAIKWYSKSANLLNLKALKRLKELTS